MTTKITPTTTSQMSLTPCEPVRSYLSFPKADCVLQAAGPRDLLTIQQLKHALEQTNLSYLLKESSKPGELHFRFGPFELENVARNYKAFKPFIHSKGNIFCFENCGSISQRGLRGRVNSDKTSTSITPLARSLLQEANAFYRQNTFSKVRCSFPRSALNSEKSMLEEIYKKQGFSGLCIGELHDEINPKKFIIDHLKTLKDLGVTTLFLENLPYDTLQPLMDSYFESDAEILPALKTQLVGLSLRWNCVSPYSYLDLVIAAKEAGIRTVCMDTSISMYAPSYVADYYNPKRRLKAMNYVAKKIIDHEKGSGKYIALMGRNHATTYRYKNKYNVPGMSSLLQCPCLVVEDTHFKKGRIRANVSRLESGFHGIKNVHLHLLKPRP